MSSNIFNKGRAGQPNDPYSRSETPSKDVMETYVPGMYNQSDKTNITGNQSPVVGFLYSISNNGIGEYWVLHLGTNTIGKSPDNDIQLLEASVSANHANISIKQMKTTGKMIAYIRDVGSKNGLYLNDIELDYEGHPCQNGDVISIGNAYKLLLIIVDAQEQGLSVADNFMSLEDVNAKKDMTPLGSYDRPEPLSDTDTIDINGQSFVEPGETKFM